MVSRRRPLFPIWFFNYSIFNYRFDFSGTLRGGLRAAAADLAFDGFALFCSAASFTNLSCIILPYLASAAEKLATALFCRNSLAPEYSSEMRYGGRISDHGCHYRDKVHLVEAFDG